MNIDEVKDLLEKGPDAWNKYRMNNPLWTPDFHGADLDYSDWAHMKLRGVNFHGAHLVKANFAGADLRLADFSFAYLSGANFKNANAANTNFSHANLCSAYLRDSNLTGANLFGANLYDAIMSTSQLWFTRGIITITSLGSRHDTLIGYCRHDLIRIKTGCFDGAPETFLRKVLQRHGDDKYAKVYRHAAELIVSFFANYPEEL